MTDPFSLDAYDYVLPPELIAEYPVSPRDAARLLVSDGTAFAHKTFADLDQYMQPGDVLVVNASKVIPARLLGVRPKRVTQDGRNDHAPDVNIEILLHRPRGDFREWTAFARPAKRLKPGDRIVFAPDFEAEMTGREADQVILRFPYASDAVEALLERYGHVPLPPYIDRADEKADRSEYQTVYADKAGSVAAPTAGLHFTDALLDRLRAKGVAIVSVTLHVGAGTFLPVTVDDIRAHKMHSEWGQVTAEAASVIRAARLRGNAVTAVGTTATRLLETAARDNNGVIGPWVGDTDIFITPGFEFRVIDRLITNFHLPKSTLMMLVSAFLGGIEQARALYAEAIARRYRFYSYGDACLLTRRKGGVMLGTHERP